MKSLGDLERLTNRIVTGSAQPRDLVGMRQTLALLPGLRGLFDEAVGALSELLLQFNLCAEEFQFLEAALADLAYPALGHHEPAHHRQYPQADGVIRN